MGLLDDYVVPVLGLPILDEGPVHRLVQFAGGVVGDVEKGRISEHGARRQRTQNKCRAGGKGASNSHRRDLLCDNTRNSICLIVFIQGERTIFFPLSNRPRYRTFARRKLFPGSIVRAGFWVRKSPRKRAPWLQTQRRPSPQ